MEAVIPHEEGVDVIKEAGGESMHLCYQCGLCSGSCPWNLVKSFPVHRMLREAQYGFFEAEKGWTCSTCRLCVKRCPRGVDIIKFVKALRSVMVEGGMIPTSIQNIMTSVALEGNPWNEPRGKRKDWARIAVKAFTPDTEWLYFSCCTLAYDPAEKKVAQTTANILRRVGVDFGILGTKESCCSESIRKVGAESLFQQMAKTNINVFMESGVKKILVSSPHCYTTFKNEYPEFGGNFEVTHVTQLLAKLLSEGRLNFSKELNIKVAYHDPCYLGRHNDIYDEPRQVLRSILGLELIEFPDNRENGVCCGGGGGGLWKGSETTESLSDLRVRQAIEAGANVLAVACPYCMINFEDSIKTAGKQDVIEVKDVTKLVEEAM